ncbi:MAG: hypothetical protein ACXWTW_08660 [Methylobacter sp.]
MIVNIKFLPGLLHVFNSVAKVNTGSSYRSGSRFCRVAGYATLTFPKIRLWQ